MSECMSDMPAVGGHYSPVRELHSFPLFQGYCSVSFCQVNDGYKEGAEMSTLGGRESSGYFPTALVEDEAVSVSGSVHGL